MCIQVLYFYRWHCVYIYGVFVGYCYVYICGHCFSFCGESVFINMDDVCRCICCFLFCVRKVFIFFRSNNCIYVYIGFSFCRGFVRFGFCLVFGWESFWEVLFFSVCVYMYMGVLVFDRVFSVCIFW